MKKNDAETSRMGQRDNFSDKDIAKLNKMYCKK